MSVNAYLKFLITDGLNVINVITEQIQILLMHTTNIVNEHFFIFIANVPQNPSLKIT